MLKVTALKSLVLVLKTDVLMGFNEGTFVNVDDISLLPNEVSKLVHQILSN
nr:hypothetical protein [Escherichia coli]